MTASLSPNHPRVSPSRRDDAVQGAQTEQRATAVVTPGQEVPAERFRRALDHLPPPGQGCHAALLGVATLGIRAGLADGDIVAAVGGALRPGTRRVPDSEILDAIRKARTDTNSGGGNPTGRQPHIAPRRPAFDGDAARAALVAAGGGTVDPESADLWESSPVRIDWPVEHDSFRLIEMLWAPDEWLYVGNGREAGAEQRQHVRTAGEWVEYFRRRVADADGLPEPQRSEARRALGSEYPHVCPNPLTGRPGQTKTGGASYRADACVARFAMAVAEFDQLPAAAQIAFWQGLGAPLVALIHSGGKSVHAWIKLDACDSREWEREVEDRLFGRLLSPLGVDAACRNESRLSRLPGVVRPEKGTWQQLLWFCPEGRAL